MKRIIALFVTVAAAAAIATSASAGPNRYSSIGGGGGGNGAGCLVYGNLITNFPSSVSGQATIKCDDANYWVSETACIQRENYTNVWSNVACASNSGWGITTISMTHFCSYTTYLDYWRMQVIGQVSGIGGSFGGSATSPVDSGHCA